LFSNYNNYHFTKPVAESGLTQEEIKQIFNLKKINQQ